MALLLSLLVGCPGLTGDPWWEDPDTGDWVDDGYFHPQDYALEVWGYYDGETIGEFQFYGNNSGKVPAYVAIYLLGPGLMCTWIGAISVEGLAQLDDEQWAGFAVSLSMTETDCDNLDPEEWGATNPTPILDDLYLGLAWKDLTAEIDADIQDFVGREGWTYEQEYEDHAYTQILGLWDPDTTRWSAHDVGPAFTYKTEEDGTLNLVAGELKKLERSDELLVGVLSGYTLDARPISEITPF